MNEAVREFVEGLFESSKLNRLPEKYGGGRVFEGPRIGVSRGNDHIFQDYKKIIGPEHHTPAELWAMRGLDGGDDLPERLRILTIIFTYVEEIREASRTATDLPAEIYSVGRNYADQFMVDVMNKLVAFFQERGYQAREGMWPGEEFQSWVREDPWRFVSTWSERHIAFAAGLGTFSLHEGLITEVGCNVRVISVLTDAPLDVTPRASDEPYGNCLHYAEGTCGECIDRCPAKAISRDGHDKRICAGYVAKVRDEMTSRLKPLLKPRRRRGRDGEWVQDHAVGCAFCQFDVPCMDKNPVGNQKT
jgi:epoxyqueuosine reductase QueG